MGAGGRHEMYLRAKASEDLGVRFWGEREAFRRFEWLPPFGGVRGTEGLQM